MYSPGASGTVSSEEVMDAPAQMGYDSGVDLLRLIEAAKRVASLIGHDIPSQIVKANGRLDLRALSADFDAIHERALAHDT